MRPDLLCPRERYDDAHELFDVFRLVVHDATLPQPGDIETWTPLECALAYDWAMREHLHASDNIIHRRPRPTFTVHRTPTELAAAAGLVLVRS